MADDKKIIDVDKSLTKKEQTDERGLLVRFMDKLIAVVVIGAIFIAAILAVDKVMEYVCHVFWGV